MPRSKGNRYLRNHNTVVSSVVRSPPPHIQKSWWVFNSGLSQILHPSFTSCWKKEKDAPLSVAVKTTFKDDCRVSSTNASAWLTTDPKRRYLKTRERDDYPQQSIICLQNQWSPETSRTQQKIMKSWQRAGSLQIQVHPNICICIVYL